MTASADDADGTDTVSFSLDDDAGGRFAIDNSTGVVTVAGALDREAAASYDITVRATSTDTTTTTRTFTITLGDVDEFDVGAVTDSDLAANAVDENAAIGTSVGVTAAAGDADATTNAISYSLDDDAGGRFAINSSTGVVTVAGTIDREAAASYDIMVRASSTDGSSNTQTITINVTDQNDNAPAIVSNNLTLVEGDRVNLNGGNLTSTDADATAAALSYTVSGVTNGHFETASFPGVTVTDFTQTQIDGGQVIFVHDGGELAPTYTVTVSDGLFSSGPQAANISFTNTNDTPHADNLSFEMITSPLTGSVIPAVSDADGDPLTILLAAGPTQGTLTLASDGTFSYSPNAGFTGVDSFAFQASDGLATSNVAIVTITVTPQAFPAPSPVDTVDLPAVETPNSDAPSDDTGSESADNGDEDEDDLLAPEAERNSTKRTPTSNAVVDRQPEAPQAGIQEAENTGSGALLAPIRDGATSGSLRQQSTESDDDAVSPDVREGRSGSDNVVNQYDALLPFTQTGQLWRELDEFHETLESDLQLSNVAIGSVGTIVSGFTVGYVLWAVRSGLLLSSVLASLPAWTMFDPLLIVSGSGPRDHDDEESLEDIVRNQAALAATRPQPNTNMESLP